MTRLRALLLPLLLAVAAIVSIQAGAAIAKSLFPVFGPEGTTSLRLLLGAALLCVFYRPWRGLSQWREPRARRLLLVYGASLGAMNLLFYVALRGLPLGICVAIEFLGPLGVAVFASRRVLDYCWIAVAVLGLALLLPWPGLDARFDPASVLAALGAAAGWAAYIVSGQKLGRHAHVSPDRSVALGMVIAAVLVLPAGIATMDVTWLDARWLWPAVLVALLSTAIPYPLEMRAMQRLPVRTFGILMSLEPAVAALSGRVMLGERLTVWQDIAIVCVMIASAGSALTARREI